jgi:hypothetical protein
VAGIVRSACTSAGLRGAAELGQAGHAVDQQHAGQALDVQAAAALQALGDVAQRFS